MMKMEASYSPETLVMMYHSVRPHYTVNVYDVENLKAEQMSFEGVVELVH
jgi:hypothetical protein